MASDDISFGFDDASAGGDGFNASAGSDVGVLRVGKRDYAVGLHWNGVDNPAKVSQEARELAASPSFGADFFCVRAGGTPQFGLGFKNQGHKSGMPSLAAHAASAKGGSWIGLFEAGGGHYLVAVRDDGILSECDRYFENADDARGVFEDFQQRSDWSQAIAPAAMDIPGTTFATLESLLEGRPSVRLHDARRSSGIIRLGLAALAVGVVVIGGMLYMDHMEELRLEEEAMAAMMAAQNAIMGPDEKVEIPPMPWEGKLLAVPFLERCVADVKAFPTDIPGWNVRAAICDSTQKTGQVSVERDTAMGGGGSMNWIALGLKDFGRGVSVISPAEGSADRVTVSWSLDASGALPTIPADIKTAPLGKMKAALLAQIEERMNRVSFSTADSNEFWTGFSFRFATKEDPIGYGSLIGALPAALLPQVSYDLNSNEWTIEGTAYEQLPLPQKPVE